VNELDLFFFIPMLSEAPVYLPDTEKSLFVTSEYFLVKRRFGLFYATFRSVRDDFILQSWLTLFVSCTAAETSFDRYLGFFSSLSTSLLSLTHVYPSMW